VDFGGGERAFKGGEGDMFVASFGPDGDHRWDRVYGGTDLDAGIGVAADEAGNVIVTGAFSDRVDFGGGRRTARGRGDVFVASYGPDGSYLWDRTFGRNEPDWGQDVEPLGGGHVVVTGYYSGSVDLGGGSRDGRGWEDAFVLGLEIGCPEAADR
jgi:hypothetical protein